MNKKFSTLMAGLMLASAFSVASAQDAAEKYEDGKYYLLGNSESGYLAVESNAAAGQKYGALEIVNPEDWDLGTTRRALWQVSITEGQPGVAPRYSFVNVATGMTLSIPTPSEAYDAEENASDMSKWTVGHKSDLMISGGYMEWLNGGANSFTEGAPLYSYVNNTDVVYFCYEDKDLYVKRTTFDTFREESERSNWFGVQPFEAKTVDLTADDLNKELIVNNDDDPEAYFNLSFNLDVTEGAETNLFAATPRYTVAGKKGL